ncbi:hypothetical protein [Novosphingobium gossypii]|uniref:hypothetical protein n=1 Tax=Novosphingobium gossypii TaxID=1604774 RepID=UPI003D192BB0
MPHRLPKMPLHQENDATVIKLQLKCECDPSESPLALPHAQEALASGGVGSSFCSRINEDNCHHIANKPSLAPHKWPSRRGGE